MMPQFDKLNTPQLRFPEFLDDWNEKQYSDIYSFKTTNSFSRDKLNYENGEVKNIHYGDIHTKFNSLFDITKEYVPFINEDVDISRIPEECYLKEGDLVIADASEDYNDIGKTIEIQNLNDEKVVAGLHTLLARRESDEMANGFASFLMKTHKIRLEIMKIAQGSKVLGISKNRLDKIYLTIPTPPEQTRIAAFLTAVDKRINLLQKKKAELEQYKKGVMQKLFSTGLNGLQDEQDLKKREKNPVFLKSKKSCSRLRFKDDTSTTLSAGNGNDFPDWEEKKLGEVCDSIKTGKTKPLDSGEFLVYGSTGAIGYCDDYSHNGKYLLAARVGANAGTLNVVDGKFGVTDNTLVLELSESVDTNFIYSYLIKYDLKKLIFGSGQPLITGGQLKSLKIFIPTFPEQQEIASFLSSIDKSINNLQLTIDNSQLFKKGLLQKMFV